MIAVRNATENDVQAITEIYNQAILNKRTGDTLPVTFKNRFQWLTAHNAEGYPVFVAAMNNVVCGWLSFSAYRPGRDAFKHTAEISYYVHDGYHRKGIGSTMIAVAKEVAAEKSITTLLAIILRNNNPSISLMEQSGFERWGILPGVADFGGEKVDHVYYGWQPEP